MRSGSVVSMGDNLRVRSHAGPRNSREFLSAYVSGYVDGEGCFTVSISPRAKLRAGWEVRPSFSVSQNGDRAEVLYAIQELLGCGSIRPDRSDRTLKWETRRLEDHLERVIPHWWPRGLASFGQAAGLRAISLPSVASWRLARIESVKDWFGSSSSPEEMNPSGTRRYDASAILRQLQGEEIVCASGNGGLTRSSDLHEWRNDLGAVSTRDPVKL